jgi:hypothetical protein
MLFSFLSEVFLPLPVVTFRLAPLKPKLFSFPQIQLRIPEIFNDGNLEHFESSDVFVIRSTRRTFRNINFGPVRPQKHNVMYQKGKNNVC